MIPLTKAIRKQLPPLGATAEQEDPLLIVKFFYPDFPGRGTPSSLMARIFFMEDPGAGDVHPPIER